MPPNETKIYIGLLVALVIVAVFLVFFIITIVTYQQKYRWQYRQLVFAEIKALENERKQIAANLHDDFGQLLSVIKMQIGSVHVNDAHGKELLRNAGEHINDTMKRMRAMSENLMPNIFFRNGSIKSIYAYINDINLTKSLRVCFFCKEEKIFDDPEKEVHLFRIIQELINNTIKHAHATELDINLSCFRNKLYLFSKDNGIGFSEPEVMQTGLGSGIRNIHNRVELLNGQIFLQTGSGNGVQYEIEIPLAYEK